MKAEGSMLLLLGVSFTVHDNVDVERLPTTSVCPDFSYMSGKDAAVIQVLQRARAIVSRKTNLDAFARGQAGTRSPCGAVPNMSGNKYISGGSISSSASVVARGFVPFALGTDTARCRRVPAGLNNMVGLKPTRRAVSALPSKLLTNQLVHQADQAEQKEEERNSLAAAS